MLGQSVTRLKVILAQIIKDIRRIANSVKDTDVVWRGLDISRQGEV